MSPDAEPWYGLICVSPCPGSQFWKSYSCRGPLPRARLHSFMFTHGPAREDSHAPHPARVQIRALTHVCQTHARHTCARGCPPVEPPQPVLPLHT